MDAEVSSLGAFIEDILERNRNRRKRLKIMKITREEISAQLVLKRRYIERQARADELFGCFLSSLYFKDKNPWTRNA